MKTALSALVVLTFSITNVFGQAPAPGGVVPKMIQVKNQLPVVNNNHVSGTITAVYPKGVLAVGADGKNFILPKFGAAAVVANGTVVNQAFQLSVTCYDAVNDPFHVNIWKKGPNIKNQVIGHASCPPLNGGQIRIEGNILLMVGDDVYTEAILTHMTKINAGQIDPITGQPVQTTIHSVLDQKSEVAHAVNGGA